MTIAHGEYFVRESREKINALLEHLREEAGNPKYSESERNIIGWCAHTIKEELRFVLDAKVIGL